MRLVHLSDLHLGFRQFQRQTAAGVNQREADVAATAARAIEQIIAIQPDVVLVGGDVFHQVRPANTAILSGFRLFSRLRAALPKALIVMIAGNHDVPRTTDSGCILQLFLELDVHVVYRGLARIDDPARDLCVVAVPYAPPGAPSAETPVSSTTRALQTMPALPPRRFNVLLAHDEVRGVIPHAAQRGDRLYTPVDPLALASAPWDYVALGHYHVYRQIALPVATANREIPCYYSGSLDYTSTNPWADVREEVALHAAAPGEGQGFIEHDLATGQHVFHPVAPARRLLDLPAIDGAGLTAAALDARIAAAIAAAGDALDDAIVRLVVHNVTRHVLRTLDYAPLRDVRRRTLHFHLDARSPAVHALRTDASVETRRSTLRDRLAEQLQQQSLAPGLDRERLLQLGLSYLTRAEDAAASALPVAEA